MKLNPLDIRKHEFPTRFRGYDPEEVDGFLQVVSQQWQELTDEIRRLESRLEEQAAKLAHYAKVEEALEQALETAREGARQRLETADQRAAMTVEDAERRAAALLSDAETRATAIRDASDREARDLLADARMRASEALATADGRLSQARQAASEASMRRSEILVRLRAFLASELELLGAFEGEPVPSHDAPVDRVSFAEGLRGETVWAAGSLDAVRDLRDADRVDVAFSASMISEGTDVEVESLHRDPGDPVFDLAGGSDASVPAATDDAGDVDTVEVAADEEPETVAAADEEPEGLTHVDAGEPDEPLTEAGFAEVEELPDTVAEEAPAPVEAAADEGSGERAVPRAEPDVAAESQPPAEAGETKSKRSSKSRPAPARQADLMDGAADAGSASDEIRKIRRILEDLDR